MITKYILGLLVVSSALLVNALTPCIPITECNECLAYVYEGDPWWAGCAFCPRPLYPGYWDCIPMQHADSFCVTNTTSSGGCSGAVNPPPDTSPAMPPSTSPATTPLATQSPLSEAPAPVMSPVTEELSCANPATQEEFIASNCTPKPNSCDWYLSCLDTCHSCGADGYAQSYGWKFCNKYLDYSLSAAATKWRDTVLLCLQNALVPVLSADLTCEEIHKKAFESHPACYTQPDNSICDLDPADWMDITIITASGVFSLDGLRQVKQVVATCGLINLIGAIVAEPFVLQAMPDDQVELEDIAVLLITPEPAQKRAVAANRVTIHFAVNPAGRISFAQAQDTLVTLVANGTLLGTPVTRVSVCSDMDCTAETVVFDDTTETSPPLMSGTSPVYNWGTTILCVVALLYL